MAEKLGPVEEAYRAINQAIAEVGSGGKLIDQQIKAGGRRASWDYLDETEGNGLIDRKLAQLDKDAQLPDF